MSKSNFWEKLDAQNTNQSNANGGGFWDKFDSQNSSKTKAQNTIEQEYTTGNRVASGAKSVVAGAGGAIPDTAALAYNLPVMGINLLRSVARPNQKRNLPLIPSATHAISEGIDKITDGYTKTPEDQKSLNQGLEFASSIATPSGAAKALGSVGAKGIASVANVFGSSNPWHIAGAGAAGVTTSALEDKGAGAALGGGIAAGATVSSLPSTYNAVKNIPSLPAKIAVGLAGVGKNKLNLEASKAAKELGIDLPATPFTDSNVTRLADQLISKTPYFGDKLRTKYKNAEEQTKQVLEQIYDQTGPRLTPEIETEINNLYDRRISELPKEASVKPQNTVTALNNVKIKSLNPSDDEKAVLQIVSNLKEKLEHQLSSSFGNVKIPLQPVEVAALADTKRSLNSTIKWDTDKGVKTKIRSFQKAIADDIAEYGKSNPEWYKTFKEADGLFAQKAKRQRLEKELGHKSEDFAKEGISYNALSKVIHDPKSKRVLENNATPEVLEKIKKLGTVAKAMAIKDATVPNKSGTAVTLATTGAIYSLLTHPIATLQGSSIVPLIGVPLYTKLLTDNKILDFAIQFAENNTKQNAVNFNQRMKAITGYTPITLAREMSKLEQEKQVENPNVIEISNPLKKHTEENKKRPKGQALNELLENPYVNGFGKSLSNPWPQK